MVMKAGWGLRTIGFTAVSRAFRDLKVRFEGDVVYVVGTNVEYAVYQEFGTSQMEAQPYLRPAARDAQRNMASIVQGARTMEDAVKLVALHIEREAAIRAPVDTGTHTASIVSAPAKEFEKQASRAARGAEIAEREGLL